MVIYIYFPSTKTLSIVENRIALYNSHGKSFDSGCVYMYIDIQCNLYIYTCIYIADSKKGSCVIIGRAPEDIVYKSRRCHKPR